MLNRTTIIALLLFFYQLNTLEAQPPSGIHWSKNGTGYYTIANGEISYNDLNANTKLVVITKKQLTPAGAEKPLTIRNFFFSNDESKLLIYTNSKKVWRYDPRGDYWVLNLNDQSLKQLGKDKPASSLMFAKFSPDDKKVAYVSEYNIYVEDLATNKIQALTVGGSRKKINGTFDWAYEEEFFC